LWPAAYQALEGRIRPVAGDAHGDRLWNASPSQIANARPPEVVEGAADIFAALLTVTLFLALVFANAANHFAETGPNCGGMPALPEFPDRFGVSMEDRARHCYRGAYLHSARLAPTF